MKRALCHSLAILATLISLESVFGHQVVSNSECVSAQPPLLPTTTLSSTSLSTACSSLRGGGRLSIRRRRLNSVTDNNNKQKNNKKTIIPPSSSSSKWDNVKQRTVPAVAMLAGVAGWLKYWGMEGGLCTLILLLQVGLYHEVCSVVNNDVKENRGVVMKWWWFATVLVGTSGKTLLSQMKWLPPWLSTELLCYGMAVVSLATFILQQNAPDTTPEDFREHLGLLASSHFALFITIAQSSFWFATLFEFGWEWVLFPALLVIVNDTMAYVFGMLFGKHALLPVISPKKTWEGFVGALLSTLLVSQPLWDFLETFSSSSSSGSAIASVEGTMIIALFVSVIAPFGGFLASITKRAYDKKDFASYIPGHGGVVDRFDCQVVTAPFVYLFLKYC